MVTSEEHQPDKKPWTVMLYMAASQNERTEQAAIRDLAEFERITRENDNVNEHLNLLVQIDRRWPGYAERYCIEKGESKLCPPPRYREKNIKNNDQSSSGNPDVLKEFVKWARSEYQAHHYLLVLWGHQYGLGFGRDHGDPLTLPEIATALTKALDGEKIDILGANACAMSYVEAAYELRDLAYFLVAPEIAMPMAGWPYDKILGEIAKHPKDKPIERKDLGEKIVQLFMNSFAEAVEPRSVSLTLLNLEEARQLHTPLELLTKKVTAAIDKGSETLRQHITDAFLDTAHGDERPLIDLADLCKRLSGIDPDELPTTERERLEAVIDAAKNLGGFLSGGTFIVGTGASPELDGINGVGIFAPAVTGAADLMRLEESREQYEKLELVQKTGWADLAYQSLKKLLDPVNRVVAEFVAGTSATTREDRFGVAQLLVSIYRSFVRLEKTLGATKKEVVDGLKGNGSQTVPTGNGSPTGQTVSSSNSAPAPSVFGWPFLRLVPDPGPSYSRGVLSPAGVPPPPGSTPAVGNGDPLLKFVEPFAKLENALSNVERTVKKVTTHARLGLGAEPPKPDLGAEPPKPDLGAEPPKPDLGAEPPKPDLGLFAWRFESNGGYASGTAETSGVTAALYGRVARSLQLVEAAVARAENDLRAIVRAEPNGSQDKAYKDLTTAVMNQSFRDLQEAVSSAKRTIIAVLADSAAGLGPTSQHRDHTISRQELAILGGLSSRDLRLLARPNGPTVST